MTEGQRPPYREYGAREGAVGGTGAAAVAGPGTAAGGDQKAAAARLSAEKPGSSFASTAKLPQVSDFPLPPSPPSTGELDRQLEQVSLSSREQELEQGEDLSLLQSPLPHFGFSFLTTITNHWNPLAYGEGGSKLGSGAFGSVYYGKLQGQLGLENRWRTLLLSCSHSIFQDNAFLVTVVRMDALAYAAPAGSSRSLLGYFSIASIPPLKGAVTLKNRKNIEIVSLVENGEGGLSQSTFLSYTRKIAALPAAFF